MRGATFRLWATAPPRSLARLYRAAEHSLRLYNRARPAFTSGSMTRRTRKSIVIRLFDPPPSAQSSRCTHDF